MYIGRSEAKNFVFWQSSRYGSKCTSHHPPRLYRVLVDTSQLWERYKRAHMLINVTTTKRRGPFLPQIHSTRSKNCRWIPRSRCLCTPPSHHRPRQSCGTGPASSAPGRRRRATRQARGGSAKRPCPLPPQTGSPE